MSCETRPFGKGFVVVCRRGGRSDGRRYFCAACLAEGKRVEATKLCDGDRAGTTCDRGMCEEHVAARPEAGVDLCEQCARRWRGES